MKVMQVARENIQRADLSNRVEVKVGPAVDTLKTLDANQPFDYVFIDADKPGNLAYFLEAKRLARKGAVIVSTCFNNTSFEDRIVHRSLITSSEKEKLPWIPKTPKMSTSKVYGTFSST